MKKQNNFKRTLVNLTPALLAGTSLMLICTDYGTTQHNVSSVSGGIIGMFVAAGVAYSNMIESRPPKNNKNNGR